MSQRHTLIQNGRFENDNIAAEQARMALGN